LVLHYAPRLLVSHLTERPDDDEAACTRFFAVVLFVDLVDSTSMTDDFAQSGGDGAERLALKLNEYFGRVLDIVDANGGDVIRIDGDAVIAVWPLDATRLGDPRAALEAATAALALQHETRTWQPFGVPLYHRLTLVCGPLCLVVLSECGGRRFFVVDGAPLKQIAQAHLRGEPNQIVVATDVVTLIGERARFARAACGASELLQFSPGMEGFGPTRSTRAVEGGAVLEARIRPFVPPVILSRLDSGQAAWIAEFRKLTAVYVRLASLDPVAADVASRVQAAIRKIEVIVAPLRIPITNVLANEKGLIVQIACGVPPFAQENAPALAIRAALRIHRELGEVGLQVGLGITTGDAFCGDVGGGRRREYLSTGPVMNYAARLMQRAEGEILCDAETARSAPGSADFSDRESMQLKGRADPVWIHHVRAPILPSAPGVGVVDAIFGRESELHAAQSRLDELADAKGGVVAIAAEAGAGKSHLLRHLVEASHRAGCLTLTTSASPVEQTTAYFALRALLAQLLRTDDDPREPSLEMMRSAALEQLREERHRTRVALLEDILPLDFADRGITQEIKGQARVAGVEDLMLGLVTGRAAGAPIVICVDDLQWMDASSGQILTALVRRTPRSLLVVAVRPVDLTTPPHVVALLAAADPVLHLPRLPRDAIRSLVCERLGTSEASAALIDFIHSRSEGLPFFAEQLLYALRDRGVFLIRGGAGCVDANDLSGLAVPGSVRDLVVSRVDLLPPGRQLAIKIASVVGRQFDAEMVADVHPLPTNRAALVEALEQLVDAGFLNADGGLSPPTYAFRHGIIREVVYELLPYGQRRPLHRSIAQRLETRHAADLSPQYAVLADHWEHAENGDRAIVFRVESAEFAAQRNAHADALGHLDRVDGLIRKFGAHLPASTLNRCTRIRADSHQELTHFKQANEHYRRLASLERIQVPRDKVGLLARIAVEAAAQALRRAGLVRRQSDPAERERDNLAAHIHMRFAEHAYFTNDMLGLAYGVLASLNRAERADAVVEVVNASGGLALGLAAFGFLRWADFYRNRSIRLAATAGSPSAQGFAELLACVQAFHVGDWDRMHLHGMRGATIWKELGDRYRYQCCLVLDAYRMVATGHFKAADEALAMFGQRAEEIDSVQVRAWALAARALVDLFLGRPPASAAERIAIATASGDLNPAECLLCNGIGAAALFEANDYPGALRAAEAGLAILRDGSPAMAGALLFSVPSIAEVFLVLADHAGAVERTRDHLLEMSNVACEAAERFAARNRICRPRASLLRGHLVAGRGRWHRQKDLYRTALAEAERLGLPLEQAMSHFALARMAGPDTARDRHMDQADQILQRFGVVMASWRRLPADVAPQGP
jgi:hypothetical protein